MKFQDQNSIPPNLIGPLKTKFVSTFPQYLPARIAQSLTATHYLILSLSDNDDPTQLAALVELSDDRMQEINGGGMPTLYPFENPEKEAFYIAELDDEDNIQKLWWVKPEEEEIKWPIPGGISIEFKPLDKPEPFNIIEYSKARGRITVDIKLEAKGLGDNLKFWSIRSFLVPFTELVKTVILDHNPNLPPNNLDKVLNFGFSKIEINCLHGILEFDYKQSLYQSNIELDNLINLYYLFNAEKEDEIVEYFNRFQNKKIIPQYLFLLRQIIKNDATLQSKMASPANDFQETYFNKRRSARVKKVIDKKMPSDTYEETVLGTLTRLDCENRIAPRFTLRSTTEDKVYNGIISPDLDKNIPELALNFKGQEYECRLKVTFTPESQTSNADYDYILLDISEV